MATTNLSWARSGNGAPHFHCLVKLAPLSRPTSPEYGVAAGRALIRIDGTPVGEYGTIEDEGATVGYFAEFYGEDIELDGTRIEIPRETEIKKVWSSSMRSRLVRKVEAPEHMSKLAARLRAAVRDLAI